MKQFFSFILILLTTFSFGQNALDFDGTNDYVQTSYPGVLGAANRTFEAWIFVSPNAPTSSLCIMDYGSSAVGARNTFYVGGNGQLGFISGGTNANMSSPASAVTSNQWVHVAFVLNNGTGFLYVNGVQVATANLSTVNTGTGNQNLIIGNRVSGGNIRFEGAIDEVRVWNVARTASEIAANKDIEFCYYPPGLKAYYKLNEGVAGGTNTGVSTAVDEISGNNGTLNGFALTGTTSNWVAGNGNPVGPILNTQNFYMCPGGSVTYSGNTYNSPGTYYDSLVGQGTNGCDSLVVVNVTLANISNDTIPMTICDGESLTVDGVNFYSTSGIYTDTTVSTVTGCDSIVTLDITVKPLPTNNQTITECEGYVITIGPNTHSTTGIYYDTIAGLGSNGCDSLVITDLTILAPVTNTQTIEICNGTTLMVGNVPHSTAGNYIDTLVGWTSSGCDSIVITNLTLSAPFDASVTNDPSTFTISANNTTAASYQWINCASGLALPGEMGQTYTVTANGNYALLVTVGNCTDTSDCIVYATIGLDEKAVTSIDLYPNPTNGKVTISNITEVFNAYDVRVLNLLGQSVYSAAQLSSTSLELNLEKKGVYFVEISQGNEQFRRKVVVQ